MTSADPVYRLEDEAPRAARLLVLLSFLAPSSIPIRLFLSEDDSTQSEQMLDLNGCRSIFSLLLSLQRDPTHEEVMSDLSILRQYGLVSVSGADAWVHAETQRFLISRLDVRMQRRFCRGVLSLVAKQIRYDLGSQDVDEALLVHADFIAQQLGDLFDSAEVFDDNLVSATRDLESGIRDAANLLAAGIHSDTVSGHVNTSLDEQLQERSLARCHQVLEELAMLRPWSHLDSGVAQI